LVTQIHKLQPRRGGKGRKEKGVRKKRGKEGESSRNEKKVPKRRQRFQPL